MTSGWPRTGLMTLSFLIFSGGSPAMARAPLNEAKTVAPVVPCAVLLTKPYIIPEDAIKLSQYAREKGLVISVLAPNPASLPFSLKPGFQAKTSELKACKTATIGGWFKGLVQCLPKMFASKELWEENKKYLHNLGYTVLEEDQNYLVVNQKGEYFYSDYDLLGLYDGTSKEPVYSDEKQEELNKLLGREIVRHGPLDDFDLRHNYGVKFPVLIFTPSGATLEIHTMEQLHAAYRRLGLRWVW